MRSYGKYLLTAFAVLLVAASCGNRRARVIPAKTMAGIYAEMFLADSWLTDHSSLRRKADTSQFFGAIFHKYGYTFEDYDKSVNHYLEDPGKFAEIFENSAKMLEKQRDILREEEKREDALRSLMDYLKRFAPPVTDFGRDTVLQLGFVEDVPLSIEIIRDTVAKDSPAAADSLASKDIKGSDNVEGRDSFRPDPLPEARKFIGSELAAD